MKKFILALYSLTLLYVAYALVKHHQAFAYNSSSDKPKLIKVEPEFYPSNTGIATAEAILESPQVWSFLSEPDLHPMKVTVNISKPHVSAGLIFITPFTFSYQATYGQTGSLILDNNGNPVWFNALSTPNLMNTDFKVQKLYGKPVLTFCQGTFATPPAYTNVPAGSAEPGARFYILDNTYKVIKTISAQQGYITDPHEFIITPKNTALLLSTKAIPMDLTTYGGPKDGYIQDFAIQEIDIKTNKLLFFWRALDHISPTESYRPVLSIFNNIWDPYHFNSIDLINNNEEILISARHTCTVYCISKSTKKIIWRLGGKNSDFTIDNDAKFMWQHDARLLDDNTISLFVNNNSEFSGNSSKVPSHGLVLQLNIDTMTANLKKSYYHSPNLQVASMGNMQNLQNGNKFIGWGESQYFSEYSQDGNSESDSSLNTIYDAKMPGNNYTYRAYRQNWIGKPYYSPKISIKSDNSEVIVYASWNGSTETATWQVFAGTHPSRLSKVKIAEKTGFETAIAVNNYGPYFKLKALDAKNKVIGMSKIIKLEKSIKI